MLPRPPSRSRHAPVRPMTPFRNTPSSLARRKLAPEESKHSAYCIAQTDDDTYESVLKSDIYKVQQQLERLDRRFTRLQKKRDRESGKGDNGSFAARRRSEIRSIKKEASQIDELLGSTSNPVERKLRLLEYLNSRMVKVENVALKLTQTTEEAEEYAASLADGVDASFSRLPSFLALVDRVLASTNGGTAKKTVSQPLEQTHAVVNNNSGTEVVEVASTEEGGLTRSEKRVIEKAVEGLLESLTILQEDLGVQSLDGEALSRSSLLAQVQVAGTAVDHLREKSIRFLQKEVEESLGNQREMGTKLAALRAELQSLKEEREKELEARDQTQAQLKSQLTQAAQAANSVRQQMDSKSVSLQTQLEECQKEVVALKTALEKEKADHAMSRAVSGKVLKEMEATLEDERERMSQEIDAVHQDYMEEQNQHQESLQEKELAISRLNCQVGELHLKVDQLNSCLATEKSTSEEQKAMFEKQIQYLNDTVKSVSEGNKDGSAEIVSSLSQYTESYWKETADKRQVEIDTLRSDLKTAREDFIRSQDAWTKAEQASAERVSKFDETYTSFKASLEAGNGNGSAQYDNVLREEMRTMRVMYEIKTNHLREVVSKKETEHAQAVRSLREKLEVERKINSCK